MTSPANNPLIGIVLDGRYRVDSLIARGGMATVFRAWDLRLERDIALKVMHPHLAEDQNFRARFRREARSAARLSHPHVVPVFDQGEDQGYTYLTMEFIHGRTVRDRLVEDGAFNLREALQVSLAILEALQTAHEADIVHRDVKPENIILSQRGRIVVTDFGLARAIGTSTSSTSASLLGTVAYIAPEIVTVGNADERSDLYSLGIVLYEMLTGQQPHRGELPVHIAFKHVHENVPAPSQTMANVPSEIDSLVAWCCEREPARRPETAREVADCVRTLLAELSPAVLDAPPLPKTDTDTASIACPTAEIVRPVLPLPVSGPGSTPAAPPLTDAAQSADETHPAEAEASELPPLRKAKPAGRHLVRTSEAKPAKQKPVRRRVFLIWLLLLLLAAGSTAFWFLLGPGAQREVPATVGLELAAAEKSLTEAGLVTRTVSQFSDSVPAGAVISSSPEAGKEVQRGSTVTLTISRGEQLFPVPDLQGKTREEAEKALLEANLQIEILPGAYSETVPEGTVLQQREKGQELPRGAKVGVTLSKGRQPIEVPKVVGSAESAARSAIEERGLSVKTVSAHSASVPKGAVIAQKPADGTLFKGDSVQITVSLGPEYVSVPAVIGKRTDEAKAELEKAGLAVKVEGVGGFPPVLNLVQRQSIGGGEKVVKGSTVTLTVV
ncbi:Stk1 family PASTA domain-containing Ser/Thr kinase [Dermabacteraceae bacterium P13115]